jgi:hypothetical protein
MGGLLHDVEGNRTMAKIVTAAIVRLPAGDPASIVNVVGVSPVDTASDVSVCPGRHRRMPGSMSPPNGLAGQRP